MRAAFIRETATRIFAERLGSPVIASPTYTSEVAKNSLAAAEIFADALGLEADAPAAPGADDRDAIEKIVALIKLNDQRGYGDTTAMRGIRAILKDRGWLP